MSNINIVIKRLQECVSKSGLSYMELEKRTKTAKSSIQRYVSGKTKKIPIDFIVAVAPHLNTTVEYLMGWEDNESENKEQNDIMSDFLSLSEEDQKKAIEYIKLLKKAAQ